jgi:NADPH-dependent glutamate synthase beta subunit-like oxidoreductase
MALAEPQTANLEPRPLTERMEEAVAIIGAGPAGLAAAEALLKAGVPVRVFEGMPTPARKFLMA